MILGRWMWRGHTPVRVSQTATEPTGHISRMRRNLSASSCTRGLWKLTLGFIHWKHQPTRRLMSGLALTLLLNIEALKHKSLVIIRDRYRPPSPPPFFFSPLLVSAAAIFMRPPVLHSKAMQCYLMSRERFRQADTTWIPHSAVVSPASRKVHKVG